MKNYLIDTVILSMFMRSNENVVKNFNKHFQLFQKPLLSILTYYEILSGLKYRDSNKQHSIFQNFVKNCEIINLSEKSITVSADIYSLLRKKGVIIDDVDILISGICIANNLVLITNNEKHFACVDGLIIENWSH